MFDEGFERRRVFRVVGVEPGLVGEVDAADDRVAFAVRAVAGDAAGAVECFAFVGACLVVRVAAEREDVVADVVEFFLVFGAGRLAGGDGYQRATGWHRAGVAVGDGVDDVFRCAAPYPVFVGEVGVAAGAAARVRGVADGAVLQEDAAACGERVRVFGEFFDAFARVVAEVFGGAGVNFAAFLLVLAKLCPAFAAFVHAGVEEEVGDGEGNHQVKQRQPPARHRVVHFFEVAVPGVVDDFAFFGVAARLDVGRPVHQADVAEDVQHGDGCDEDADCGHLFCLLFCAVSAGCRGWMGASFSSLRASFSASS